MSLPAKRRDGRVRSGFASMSPERLLAVTRKGARRQRALGLSHQWTVEEARRAGRLGAQARAIRQQNRQK